MSHVSKIKAGKPTLGRNVKTALIAARAIKRAATLKERAVFRHHGQLMVVMPVRDLRLLERLIEQEEDRRDIAEAERRLADPTQVPVPYADVCKRLGLPDLPD